MVSVDVWQKVGGFDQQLFIDMVDADFCYRLRLAGYKIICINKVGMIHELGDTFRIRFLYRDRTILNHSAFRKYYIFRNTIYVLRKYKIAHDYRYFDLIKNFIGILLYEDSKASKIKRSIKGIVDGIRMR